MGEWLHKRFFKTGRTDDLEQLILVLQIVQDAQNIHNAIKFKSVELNESIEQFEQFGSDIQIENYQDVEEMKNVFQLAKKFWQVLNSDIAPVFQSMTNELAAIYEPQLVPVRVDGMTIEWVDQRTGKKPLFS